MGKLTLVEYLSGTLKDVTLFPLFRVELLVSKNLESGIPWSIEMSALQNPMFLVVGVF